MKKELEQIKQEKKDINNSKEFHQWIRGTFDWIDSDVKRYMLMAWCARRKTLK